MGIVTNNVSLVLARTGSRVTCAVNIPWRARNTVYTYEECVYYYYTLDGESFLGGRKRGQRSRRSSWRKQSLDGLKGSQREFLLEVLGFCRKGLKPGCLALQVDEQTSFEK